MKVLIEVGHPAHVHMFRPVGQLLVGRGAEVRYCAFDKDVTVPLLKAFNLPYTVLARNTGGGMATKASMIASATHAMWVVASHFEPDVFLSRVSPISGLISRLKHRPHISFCDTDFRRLGNTLEIKLTDVFVTPTCFGGDFGKKHVRIDTFKEIAYLHPRYFTPDPGVLALVGLDECTPFSIVRFVSWQAAHDIGQGGFSREGRIRLVHELAKHGRVLVSAEGGVPPELSAFAFTAPPHLIHHFLYYASVCVTEGATMASECAVLGTPAVYMNTLRAGTLQEQQDRYGLVFNFHNRMDEDAAASKAVEALRQGLSNREYWRAKGRQLVDEHIDVTAYLVSSIELAASRHVSVRRGNSSEVHQ